MFVKNWISLALLLLLSGCASSPELQQNSDPAHFEVPQQHAYLYLYREKTFSSGLAGIVGTIGHNNISIDGSANITLNNAEYYIIELMPGKHSVTWSLVLMGYETDSEQVDLSVNAGGWTQLNFSDMDERPELSLKQLKLELQPLDFVRKIQLLSQ